MDNHSQMRHEMIVKQTFESGAQEWYCPVCGRDFILQYPPSYKRIVLDEGDPQAVHADSAGGLRMGSTEISQPPETNHSPEAYAPGGKGSSDSPCPQENQDDPYL